MKIDVLGIDLAKQVFQLHGADRRGHVVHRSKVSRNSFFESVRTLNPSGFACLSGVALQQRTHGRMTVDFANAFVVSANSANAVVEEHN